MYFVGPSSDGNYYASSLRLTTRYSLEQMREFAFKNAVANNNYKPSMYIRWNYSFNRILEDSENKYDLLFIFLVCAIC